MMTMGRWLGHGRATECGLATVGVLYGIILLYPSAPFDSRATEDLAWYGYGRWLAVPLLVYGAIGAWGLAANIMGWPWSRYLRVTGALMGVAIWSWFTFKLVLVGGIATVGFPFSLLSAVFSLRIVCLAQLNLPRPTAPGAL